MSNGTQDKQELITTKEFQSKNDWKKESFTAVQKTRLKQKKCLNKVDSISLSTNMSNSIYEPITVEKLIVVEGWLKSRRVKI